MSTASKPSRLKNRLYATPSAGNPAYELLNFGVGRYSPLHRRLQIEREVRPFEPYIVVYFAHQDYLFTSAQHLGPTLHHGMALNDSCLEDVVRRAGVVDRSSETLIQFGLERYHIDVLQCLYNGMVTSAKTMHSALLYAYLPIPGGHDLPFDPQMCVVARGGLAIGQTISAAGDGAPSLNIGAAGNVVEAAKFGYDQVLKRGLLRSIILFSGGARPMLRILGSPTPFAVGCHRREVLRAGLWGSLGLSLPLLESESSSANDVSPQATFGAAKRVLLLYLQGAASQFETWDPKPDAPEEIRGKWGAIHTAVPGVSICEQLPKLSRLADRLAIVRSMTHDHNNHSNLYTLSGFPAVDFTSETNPFDGRHHPFFGSVLDYLGRQHEQTARTEIPQNIGLPFRFSTHSPLFRRAGPYGMFLGQGYDPVWTEFEGQATQKVERVVLFDQNQTQDIQDPFLGITPDSRLLVSRDARLRPDVTIDRLETRRTLLEQLDERQKHLDHSLSGGTLDRFNEMAYSLMTSPRLRDALDISQESIELRERYGMNLFGQSALTARRLLEAGCSFVSVFWDEYKIVNTAWDTHFDHFTRLGNELLPGFDSGVSSLLMDLESRGLLQDTLVLCLTEHGRTPKIEKNKRGGGRDHWSKAYSVMLAGAGIQPGTVVGASDAQGAFVKDHPVTPEDILATVYHLKGINPNTTIPDRLGRPMRLVDTGEPVAALLG
ncbi:MAG TPA: DUF1501 domain-containing protein [Planctomycetaceae bacterium]|nr:DUF1501 domain-containing protein [Planctomycetaceae bacterium]